MTSRPRSTSRPGCSPGASGWCTPTTRRIPCTTFAFHLYLNAFRPGSPLGGRRFHRAEPALQRSQGPGLRLQPRPQRADHGQRRSSRSSPSLRTAPSSASCCRGRSRPATPWWWTSTGTPARPPCPGGRGGGAGAFDFAQWYPKVVVYDRHGWEEHPLYPAGEFYGEFATFLVDLDLPADQVMGATGVPICGDPGWERANRHAGQTDRLPAGLLPKRAEYRAEGDDCLATDGRTGPTVGPSAPARPEAHRAGTPRTCTTSPCRSTPSIATKVASGAAWRSTCSTSRGMKPAGVAASPCSRTATALAVAGWLLRPLRLAADHQRAPDRGRRHRVPDDDPRRLGRARG